MNKNFYKRKVNLLLLFISIFIISCEPNDEPGEDEIETTLKWKINLRVSNCNVTIEHGIIYAVAGPRRVSAINAETGKELWSQAGFDNIAIETEQLLDEKYIYVINRSNGDYNYEDFLVYCTVLDKETGEIIKNKEIGKGWYQQVPRYYFSGLHNGIVYWPGSDGNIYANDVHDDEAETYIVYSVEREEGHEVDIMSEMVFDGNVLYFGYDKVFDNVVSHPYLVAVDTADGSKVVFETFYTYSRGSFMTGGIQIYNDKLYLSNGAGGVMGGIICADKRTGEILWENTDNDAASQGGMSINNDVIYVVSSWDTKNVFAVNALTGKTLWTQTIDARDHGTLLFSGQAYEGYFYLPTQAGLTVFNAKTGKLIGRDPRYNLGGLAVGRSITYNDTIIYRTLRGEMHCVKMDFHKRKL